MTVLPFKIIKFGVKMGFIDNNENILPLNLLVVRPYTYVRSIYNWQHGYGEYVWSVDITNTHDGNLPLFTLVC